MINYNQFRPTAAVIILLAMTTLTMADDAKSPEKPKAKKAPVEKRQAEVDARQGVAWLGLTLVDPTEQLMKQYEVPKDAPGPIITQVQDPFHFPAGQAPSAGCAFFLVEPQANG